MTTTSTSSANGPSSAAAPREVWTDGDGPRITNAWGEAGTSTIRLQTEAIRVDTAVPDRAYKHHAHIAALGKRLVAVWSEGYRDEDMCGQRVMTARSEDLGRSWTAPVPLADRSPGRLGYAVLTPGGLHVQGDRLVAYVGRYDLTEQHVLMYYASGGNNNLADRSYDSYTDTRTDIYVSDDGGESWGPAGEPIAGFMANLGPQGIGGGRLLMPANFTFMITDDPAGLNGWRRTALPSVPADLRDDPEGHVEAAGLPGLEDHPNEASCFLTDAGAVRMMFRSNRGVLLTSLSTDRGETWSAPQRTGYTDAGSRHQFGRLPDGRVFGLNNAQPGSVRTPLVLALSDDGVRFDRHFIIGEQPNHLSRIPGVHKYGRYGYPYLCFLDGWGVAIHSINKEDIEVIRFRLDQLD